MGCHQQGSDISPAFSSAEDCSASLHDALKALATADRFDGTHRESLRYTPCGSTSRRGGSHSVNLKHSRRLEQARMPPGNNPTNHKKHQRRIRIP